MLNYGRYIPLWTEALEAKYYGKASPYGRSEFDKVLGDFDVSATAHFHNRALEIILTYL